MKAILRSGFLALAIMALAVPVDAEPFEDGKAAYDRGEYAMALRLLRPLAEQGDANAQFIVGLSYSEGEGLPQHYREALKWFRKAAEQGLAEAQSELGKIYYDGPSVLQNNAEAAKWYFKAAEQGDADAQNNLGYMYANGKGLPREFVSAHMWFNLAAASGNAAGVTNRDILAERMSSERITEAQRMAREWMAKHQQ